MGGNFDDLIDNAIRDSDDAVILESSVAAEIAELEADLDVADVILPIGETDHSTKYL